MWNMGGGQNRASVTRLTIAPVVVVIVMNKDVVLLCWVQIRLIIFRGLVGFRVWWVLGVWF